MLRTLLIETAGELKGRARRLFMARTVKELGPGGQRLAERELGWSRMTIRKGLHELRSGLACEAHTSTRGRKGIEERLPNLLRDIRIIVEEQRRADPRCRGDQQLACLSATEVRRRLLTQKGYTDTELPTVQTIANKLKALGYRPGRMKGSPR